jgi:hypothetical protein
MEKIMKTSLDALKYQSTAFQEDCYEQVTSGSVQSGIHFLYASCTTCYINIRRFPSRWNDLAD